MANIRELYKAKHGENMLMLLDMLNGNSDEVVAYWQDRLDNPSDADLQVQHMLPNFFRPLTEDKAIDAIHNQLIREIIHRYFADMPRETAVAIANTLYRAGDFGRINIYQDAPEFDFNSFTFYRAWNEHNPDAVPIRPPHIDIG